MTPSQKAAIILGLTGDEYASNIIKNIPKFELKKLLQAFSRLPSFTENDIENISKEFLEIIKKLEPNNKFSLESAKRILISANQSLKDDQWIKSISSSFLIDDIRNILNDIDNKILLNWLKNEHPQVLSLVISICSPEKSSYLFKKIQEQVRCEIILRISQLNHIDTYELENLQEELEKLQKNINPTSPTLGGFEKIRSVLQVTSTEQREKLLEGIELRDPELAKNLIESLLSVNKLSELNPNHLSILCSNLTDSIISLALRLEQPNIKEKYLSSISKKRREIIEEEMLVGKHPIKDAENAASLIVKKALELKNSGKIIFPWEETLV